MVTNGSLKNTGPGDESQCIKVVMIEVRVLEKSAAEIMLIIKEMANDGIVQGRDFDFAYHPARYKSDGWEKVSPKHTVFAFYTEQMATFFMLKYAH